MKPKALMAKLLLAVAMAAAMAAHAVDVSYIDPTEPGSPSKNAACTQYNGQDTLTSGWYVVEGDVFNGSRIFVKGDVNLILKDNAELTVGAGIIVDVNNNVTNSLTIWAQSDGANMGKLTAFGGDFAAGIGGGDGDDGGTVTVNGGKVTARGGGLGGAGIGGGYNGSGGTVTVNGGKVTATSNNGVGIGGGDGGSGGTVTINGGEVTAQGGDAGIGGGRNCSGGTVTVNGGKLTAQGGSGGAGIGGTVTVNGGEVTAFVGLDGSAGIGGTVTIKPAGGKMIAVEAGAYAGSAVPVAGSPFAAETDVTDVLDGKKFVRTEALPTYLDPTDPDTPIKVCDNYTLYTGQTELTSGWYVVEGSVTNDDHYNITVNGDVNLLLKDNAELNAPKGIKVDVNNNITNSLTIWAQSDGANMGKLTAEGTYGNAGIGGEYRGAGGTVTINGGEVTAKGGPYGGAGIGGGDQGSGGTVTVNGGKVTATGYNGAGIGGGVYGTGGTVTVNGGKVTANGGDACAGIGGGIGAAGGKVTINGGEVTAKGGTGAAGIGAGNGGTGGTVTVKPSAGMAISVAAGDDEGSATPVAGSPFAKETDVTDVLDGKRFVQTRAGIGYLDPTDTDKPIKACDTYTLYTGQTTLTSGWYVVEGSVNVSGRITVKGDAHLLLLDNAELANNGITVDVNNNITNSLTIWAQSDGAKMGKLTAMAMRDWGAGVGGENGSTCGTVTVNGGNVTAQGHEGGAGIGGGDAASGGTVTVNGGKVTAEGGDIGGAGIGGGGAGGNGSAHGDGGTVTVNGGNVTAKGGGDAAGIGGGANGSGGTVTITGGEVTATGDYSGAGIGGGYHGSGGKVTVTGGTVKAQGGNNGGAGIGGGRGGSGGTVTVKPSAGIAITVAAGADEGSASSVSGLPFMAETDVTGSLGGMRFVRTKVLPTYLDPTDADKPIKACDTYTPYTGQTTLDSGWYVVEGSVNVGGRITVSGDAHLLLLDNAELAAGAGINVDVDGAITNSLTIWAQSDGASMGKLTARGKNAGAGIGGEFNGTGGMVTVNGGEVTAKGDTFGAGIGGGNNGDSGTVTVNGGEVTAKGGTFGAGIGGGANGSGGTVTINGGEVTATGDGGIGGTVTVKPSAGMAIAVSAGANEGSATPIDGSPFMAQTDVTGFLNGKKFVRTKTVAPYLDPADPDNPIKLCDAYTIYTGQTELTNGWYVVDGSVTNDARISVKGDVNLILCDGVELAANSGINVDVNNNVTNSLTIWAQSDGANRGRLTAKGSDLAAGIGGDNGGSCGTVTVNGGTVRVRGGSGGAGIGGGYKGAGGTVTVNGGDVKATGVGGGAGIGGGYIGSGVTVTVNGGTVTAQGDGGGGAGIGGGALGAGGTVTISGGTVTATGDYYGGAGIGGGALGAGWTVTINPSAGIAIAVAAGGDEGSATPVSGSPFTAETDVTGSLSGKKFVRTWVAPFHTVTVEGGSTTNVLAAEGSVVTVTASYPQPGEAFVQWAYCDGVDFADMSASETSFLMPTNDVTVTAVFKEIFVNGIDPQGYPWTGKAVVPKVVVSLDGVDLLTANQYEISCSNNVNSGKATMTVTMLPPLVGDTTVEFTILPKPSVSNVTATVHEPWDGKVDLTFDVGGNWSGLPDWNKPFLSIVATDNVTGSNYVSAASALTFDTGVAEPNHHVTWDLRAQGVEFASTNVTFTVTYLTLPDYCIIDLSGGSNATSYAVSYLDFAPAGGFTNDLYKTTNLAMRLIGPEADDKQPFYCAVFETTQKQWELVTGSNPSGFKGNADSPMRPVETVSWDTICGDTFLGALRSKTGLDALDLPTDAQWEYACRAGKTTTYSYGDDANGDYMWFAGNSTDQTHAVGTKRPNAWGLYDMHGNVWEWCLDLYDPELSYRVERGGSWSDNAVFCTSSVRGNDYPSDEYGDLGFRLVRTLSDDFESERSAEAAAGAERAGTVCAGMSDPISIATYAVTVEHGSTTNLLAAVGSTVAITANEPLAGEAFVQWTSNDGVNFNKADAAETTFVMPGKPVTVTAVCAPILIKDLSGQGYPYTGEPIEPEVTVEFEGVDIALQRGTDYAVSYTSNTNAGTATLTVTMLPPRLGSQCTTFEITPLEVTPDAAEITLALPEGGYVGDGTAKEPAASVLCGGRPLAAGVDYDIAYSDNVEPGTATVTVTFKGNYAGTASAHFDIAAPAPEPQPQPQPEPQPQPQPEPQDGRRVLWYTDAPFQLDRTTTYNGYLLDTNANDAVVGMITVKAGKPNKTTGASRLTVTIRLTGQKAITVRGSTVDGTFRAMAGKASPRLLDIALGLNSLSGAFGPYLVDGSRDMFAARDADSKARSAQALDRWKGNYAVAWKASSAANAPYHTLTVAVKAKGRVTVKGTLADGTRVLSSTRLLVSGLRTRVNTGSRLLVGERECAVAVSWAKKDVSVSCLLWFGADGTVTCESLPDGATALVAPVGGGFAAGATLRVDASSVAAAFPGILEDLSFPDGAPAELKLKCKAADGTFSGSFKVYVDNGRRVGPVTVKVCGVVLDGKGYGSAYVKKVGDWEATVE